MDPGRHRALVLAAAWALPTAAIAPRCLPAAAAIAGAGLVVATATSLPGRRAGLLALPMLLCAAPGRAPPTVQLPPGPAWVSGVVDDVVRTPATGRTAVTLRGGQRVQVQGQLEVVPGDGLRVLAMVSRPAAPGWMPAVRAAPTTAQVSPGSWGPRRACALLRRALERSLLELVPDPHGATLATLVLGRATRPDFALTEAHRATGLSHLLAVSGAHAAMLAYLLGLTNRGRRLGAGRARLTFVVSVLCAYGCVAGAEPPVVRAVVAFVLSIAASRTGRSFGLVPGLLAPALVTAAWEPSALTSASFLLSYAAVVGLGVAATGAAGAARGWWSTALRASFWATLMTAPLTLWFFGQLAPTTILLTPICAPLVAVMLLLGLVAASLAALAPALAGWIGPLLHALAAAYAGVVRAADALPGTPIPAWTAPPAWLVALACAAVAAWLWARPGRRSLLLGVTLLAALWFVPASASGPAALRVLAVGHGQAALISTAAGAQVLVDCGSLQGGRRAARAVTDALAELRLDLLVVTHEDADHHNGLPALLERVVAARAVVPAAMAGTAVHALLSAHVPRVELLDGGAELRAGAVCVSAPRVPEGAADNDRSLWVRASLPDGDVLLSGDAQELGVAAALAQGIAAAADVLLLPHHGRANRNLAHLLGAVRPRACLASSSGEDGDTATGAVARRFGAEVWTTGRHGDLCFSGGAVTAARAPPLLARSPRR